MKFILILIAALQISSAFAIVKGGQEGNGGDICEDRFKIVRDDIHSWILAGGPSGLSLPSGISLNQYSTSMLSAIATSSVSCTDDVITIGGVEKACKNSQAIDGSESIVCNSQRFSETSESDQYVLVHHEYAGLAGFEVTTGNDSVYTISNQISEYLVDATVKKLGIKPVANPSDPFDPSSCQGAPMSQNEAILHFFPGNAGSETFGATRFYQRFRTCNSVTGCGNWNDQTPTFVILPTASYAGPDIYQLYTLYGGSKTPLGFYLEVSGGKIVPQLPSSLVGGIEASCSPVTDPVVTCNNIYTFGQSIRAIPTYAWDNQLAGPGFGGDGDFTLQGLVTNKCLRLKSSYTSQPNTDGQYHDVETVWYGTF